MKAFLEARAKEFAILLHLGMEKRQLSKLIFYGNNVDWNIFRLRLVLFLDMLSRNFSL